MKTHYFILFLIVFVRSNSIDAQRRLVLQHKEDSSIQKEIHMNDYLGIQTENKKYNNVVLGYTDSTLFISTTKKISDTQYLKRKGKYKREINTTYYKDTEVIRFDEIVSISRRRITNIDFLENLDYFGLTALFNILYLPADLLFKQQTFQQWLITESLFVGIYIVPNYAFTRRRKFSADKWKFAII